MKFAPRVTKTHRRGFKTYYMELLDDKIQLYLTASSWEAKSDSKWTILSSIGGNLLRSTSSSWLIIFTWNKIQ